MIPGMDEFQAGKQKLIELVRSLDPALDCVIPSRSTGGYFRVGLGKGNHKVFLSLTEDEILDLEESEEAMAKMKPKVEELLKGIPS